MNSQFEDTPFSISERIRYHFYSLIVCILSKLSLQTIDKIARMLGWIFWNLLLKRRAIAIKAIQKHLGYSLEKATAIARASFTENCRSFLEILQVSKYDAEESVTTIISEEIFTQFKEEKSPIVVASAHIGSWEVMAAMMNFFQPETQKIIIVRTQRDRAMAQLMKKLRGSRGIEPIGHRQASTAVMNCLRKNGIAAFLVDHNCSRKEAIFLPFLNDIAAVNSGPAMLALRSKAVIYPIFNLRTPQGTHIFYMYPPLATAELEGTIKERVEVIARYYTDCVADIIKKYPEQWLWMHNRWKTKP